MKKNIIFKTMFIFTMFFLGGNFVSAATYVSCGLATGIPVALPTFSSNVISIVKILIPIILIFLGIFDFSRAVISNDEKGMKESQSRFIRRIISGIAVFFVVSMVQLVFNLVETDDDILGCVKCFVNNDCRVQGSVDWRELK